MYQAFKNAHPFQVGLGAIKKKTTIVMVQYCDPYPLRPVRFSNMSQPVLRPEPIIPLVCGWGSEKRTSLVENVHSSNIEDAL